MTSTGFEAASTATVNGTPLAYREQGEGEPVVFVHGAISDLRTWEQQLPAVGRSYRAIAYSRRFARPNQDIDPGLDDPWLPHVEDLAAFVREIDAAPAHLVGNSYGAFLSPLTAVRHPDVVRSLVMGRVAPDRRARRYPRRLSFDARGQCPCAPHSTRRSSNFSNDSATAKRHRLHRQLHKRARDQQSSPGARESA